MNDIELAALIALVDTVTAEYNGFIATSGERRFDLENHPLVADLRAELQRRLEPAETPEPEPVAEWPKREEIYNFLNGTGAIDYTEWLAKPADFERYAIGNCFHPETKLNQHGVHIDNARKLFLLALADKKFARGVLRCMRSGYDFTAPFETRMMLQRMDHPDMEAGEPRES